MKKITKLEIRNFKSHKHTVVEFGDFTAILGATNDGKSAMLAALKWALYNTPSGTGFIRHGMALCMVEVSFDDGSILTRLRSSEDATEQQNKYTLTYPDGRQILLEHFGVGPTEQVIEFHGMHMLDLFGEKESINVCGQFDPPFFLSKSPQLKATLVGRLSGVSAYDLANKISDSDARSQKKEKKAKTKELKEIEAALKAFDTLDKDENSLKIVKVLYDKIMDDRGKCIIIERMAKELEYSVSELDNCKKVLMYKDAVNILTEKLSKLTLSVQNVKVLNPVACNLLIAEQNLSKQIDFLLSFSKESLAEYQNRVDDIEKNVTSKIDIDRAFTQLSESCEDLCVSQNIIMHKDDVDKLAVKVNSVVDKCYLLKAEDTEYLDLINFSADLDKKKKDIDILQDDKLSTKQQYAEKLREAKICPTCFSEISEHKAYEIVDKLEE